MPKVIAVIQHNEKEFLDLLDSIDYEIAEIIKYNPKRLNTRYYVGHGKLDKIKEAVKNSNADLVVIDGFLKSSQWFLLEKEIGVPVMDRVRLILEIFASHARSREAMLQVEYARLKYEIPRLRELIHRAKLKEHPGFMAGGEYKVDDYYEMICRRLSRIRKKIEKIKKERYERRKRRRREGYILVGIAGYTNCGKSTLLHALTGKDVIIEGRMFSTLSTRTSKVGKDRILITDTVGFVAGMPPWLIKAFEPTLEEIYESDVVLLLMDGSDDVPLFKKKMDTVMEYISPHIKGALIPVINKIDIANDLDVKKELASHIGEPILISAKNGTGLDELVERIKSEGGLVTETVLNPSTECFRYIERFGRILSIEYDDSTVVKFQIRRGYLKGLKNVCGTSSGKDALR